MWPASVFSDVTALQAQVDALWARTSRSPSSHLLSIRTRQEAHWYVETSESHFRFVQWERGHEEPLTEWLTLPQAAHWVLAGMAANIAQADELHHRQRHASGYSRWNWMAAAVDLMAQISPAHGTAMAQVYHTVLAHAPLDEEERNAARWPLPA